MQSTREAPLPIPPAATPDPTTPPELSVAVSATYTAEPIEGPLRFWIGELGFDPRVRFADYSQLIPQLLDPGSLFAANARGINVALVRVEDFARARPGGWDEATIAAGVDDLADAFRSFAERSNTPTIIATPPASPQVAEDPARAAFLVSMEARLRDAVVPFDSLHWLGRAELASHDLEGAHDAAGDRVGHMPYTPLFEAALATDLARRIHLIQSPPRKVIALDCDNTLWKGVVGEDGIDGITLGPGMKALQEFVVEQQAAGMVVCLVSKNAEADVLDAFDARSDFPLRREHLVSWRIGWGRKSQALVELAEELNLGLDSFIFLDDNPVECAEVRAALPQVLTLQVPPDEELADFLRHAWFFDRRKITEEDRARTRMYRENADRSRVERQVSDIGTFLASLDIRIDIGAPREDQWARVSQLTQRTNQFNASTVRRSEAEVRRLAGSGLEVLRVEVSDRFGDYGLVGVLIFGAEPDTLVVDTMLLSCRVLGRGVEHAMLAHLGRLARDRVLSSVRVGYVPTPKNEPALNFLKSLPEATATPGADGNGTAYRVPAATAAELVYRPGSDAKDQLELARTGGKPAKATKSGGGPGIDLSALHGRIIAELHRPEAVLGAVARGSIKRRALEAPFVPPHTAVQRELASIWSRVLLIEQVGIRDDFTALGGTSLKAARMFVEIEAQFGIRLPMTTILEAATIEELAVRLTDGRSRSRESLKLLKPGAEGGPSLFLVHDGDSETLLYLNLARRLPDSVAVFGLEPAGDERSPYLHTRIPEMAAHYAARVVSACPSGPILLGGMCAGGIIAYEMARQLTAEGRRVGLVALLDAAAPQAKVRPFREVRLRLQRFRSSLRGKAPAQPVEASEPGPVVASHAPKRSRIGSIARKAAIAAGKVRSLAAYELGAYRKRRADAANVRTLRAILDRGGSLPEDYAIPTYRTVYKQAESAYRPEGLLDVPVVLFRAGAGGHDDPSDEPFLTIYRDERFGWGRHVRSVEVIDVPGGHGGMLQEPHVSAIAEPLADRIDRVQASEATP
ncbi:HAD-IIIC family phosphatase [Tundrisphaera sp. TA3]|uniref:HAD-IIIC family phosphatase n=1 Tax=Tundrisphaera sp. TA3 TaxID=3435775 RepID=UPI003EC04CF7